MLLLLLLLSGASDVVGFGSDVVEMEHLLIVIANDETIINNSFLKKLNLYFSRIKAPPVRPLCLRSW